MLGHRYSETRDVGDHVTECPNCGSNAVRHDTDASDDSAHRNGCYTVQQHWYDCERCQSRLTIEWVERIPDEQSQSEREISSDRVSTFEMSVEY